MADLTAGGLLVALSQPPFTAWLPPPPPAVILGAAVWPSEAAGLPVSPKGGQASALEAESGSL